MNEFFKDAKQDRVIFAGSLTSFILAAAMVIYILFYYGSLPPFVPLFNQLPWGNNRLGIRIMIFIPVLMVLCISIFNIFISSILYKKAQIVSRMLSVASLLIAFLSFLFVIRTVQLVI
ncbi:hypothetical protein M1146_02290 [Patescibacteria group bacterium]|nr:hypothetical protein [Patescibacteria group bacterium]